MKLQKEKLPKEKPPKKYGPFDASDPDKTPLDIIYQCGRHGLPSMHAIMLLRGNISTQSLDETAHALEDPDSQETQSYNDGLAMGEADMSAALRENTIMSRKDAYKSMNAEDRKRAINASIRKNFGIGE